MKKLFLTLMAIAAIALTGCEKKPNGTSEKVETISATDITSNGALLTGRIGVEIADYMSVEFGMLISQRESDVSSYDGKMLVGDKLIGQTFSITANGLSEETQYYYRAYLILNNMQYEYGDIKSFKTTEKGGTEGNQYVDLGLSVKWATCNVGASKPEEYGDYFAWGETSPKEEYTWSTYKYMQSGESTWEYITKYTIPDGTLRGIWYNGNTFIGDNKKVLEPTDDAVRMILGGNWRMPTKAEQDELRNNCTWTWTQKNGINGYEVKGTNGNSIFLPASGYRYTTSWLYHVGYEGNYWSSSVDEFNSVLACFLYFYSDGPELDSFYRFYGYSIRPVCQYDDAQPQ